MSRQYLVLNREREDAFPLHFEDMMTGGTSAFSIQFNTMHTEMEFLNGIYLVEVSGRNFFSKCNYHRPTTKRTFKYRRSLQPSKENIQQKKKNSSQFSLLWVIFVVPGSGTDEDPDRNSTKNPPKNIPYNKIHS